MRTYVFVDAENHYHRSEDTAAKLFNLPNALELLPKVAMKLGLALQCVPTKNTQDRFACDRSIQLFWDFQTLLPFNPHPYGHSEVGRAVYACSCAGDEQVTHDARVRLRELGFEPLVVRELKVRQRQREALREGEGLIDKAKGCDIAIATRMVADAAAGLYDRCALFTSDADFLPAIEAVRRMGKVVYVYGYKNVLPKHSPYLHVPDEFYDLEPDLARLCDREDVRRIMNAAREHATPP